MTPIADSDAVRDGNRVLPQHQAALTLLQERLQVPETLQLTWLDLACGRGQIILSLRDNLSDAARAKIGYWAYDLDNEYAKETTKTAMQLGLASLDSRVGDLSQFDQILPSNLLFDFITLTNTVHEIEPSRLAAILVAAIGRLTNKGTLFVYDMELINPPELGAVPWSRDDVRKIVFRIVDALGATSYRPEVGLWHHSTTNGWNVQIQRQHLAVKETEFARTATVAVQKGTDEIEEALKRRLVECRASLAALTRFGAQTAEEQQTKERLLYEFWALSLALAAK